MNLAKLSREGNIAYSQGGHLFNSAYRAVVRRLFEQGRLGRKSRAGYYHYESRQPQSDAETARICVDLGDEHRVVRRTDHGDVEIVERRLSPLINEGARILKAGIAARAGDIDTVSFNGYVLPNFKGRPICMADLIGLPLIVDRLAH